MNVLRQIVAVSLMSLGNLRSRAGMSLVTVVGVAAVVAVMISLLGLGEGLLRAARSGDQPGQVMVLQAGAPTEYLGAIGRADAALIAEQPMVARDTQGEPRAQPQAAVLVELMPRRGDAASAILLRGSGPVGLGLRGPGFRITSGRLYRPGLRELIVGEAARRRFKGLEVGGHVLLRGVAWSVVGVFQEGGDLGENSLVGDADTVLAAFGRGVYQSVLVQLRSPADLARLQDGLGSDPRLNVTAKPLGDYYQEQVRQLIDVLKFVGFFIGGMMGAGVVFGALNTSCAAVDARVRAVATLRALGFSGVAVATSVLVESLIIALPGAFLGAAIAWLAFNHGQIAMGGLSFSVSVTGGLVLLGAAWALAIGLLGGIAPAWRCARRPIVEGLRAL